MFKYIILALIVYKYADAYVGILAPVEKPAKFADQEGCYVPNLDRVLKVNVPYSPIDGSTCTEFVCRDNNETFINGCGAKGLSDGCERIPPNYTLPYPDCCDKVRCTLPDGTVVEV